MITNWSRLPALIPRKHRFPYRANPRPARRHKRRDRACPLRDEDYLILSTIHSAKGQEWTAVYVLNVSRRLHPFRPRDRNAAQEMEEERRLLYVAMTRAKDDLQSDCAAALLYHAASRLRRPPCICRQHS